MRKLLAAMLVFGVAPAALAEGEVQANPAASPEAPTAAAAPAGAVKPGVSATAPAAPTVSLAPSDKAKKEDHKGFRLGVSVDHRVGQGTFEDASMYAFVGGSLVVRPSYGFSLAGVSLGASATLSGSYEYTQPNNSLGRHWSYQDIGLGLSAPAIFKDEALTGISLTPSIGVTLPISLESLWRQKITNLTASLGASRAFGKFSVGLRVGASKTLYGSLTREFTPEEISRRDANDNLIFVCRTDAFNCGLRGNPTLWALSGGVNAGWSPLDKLSFSLGLNLAKSFIQSPPRDELSSDIRSSTGDLVVNGNPERDVMIGSLGVSYQLTDTISAAFGMGTAQQPKSSDGRRFLFPWFALEGQELGLTAYSLTLSGSY